jgi:hypothetical protein
MKWTSIFLLGAAQCASAAVYTMNLSGAPGTPANGLDGWVQSEADFNDGEAYPRSFVNTLGTSTSLALGGYYDSEPATNGPGITTSRALSGLGMNQSDLVANFTIVDSDSTATGRNQFSIGYRDASGGDLFSLVFRPVGQSATPGTNDALWNVHWSTGGNLSAAFLAISEGSPTLGGIYSLSLSTAASATAGAVDFNVSIGSFTQSGTLTGLAGADIASVQLGWRPDGAEGLGTNFMQVGDLSVVPEPSSLLLSICSVLPLVLRRRRPIG